MTPRQRRRFTAVLLADGAGTAAFGARAVRAPRDPAAVVDAAAAVLGWTAAVLARRSAQAGAAARWTLAGTTATLGGAAAGVLISRRTGRPAGPSVLLLVAGGVVGGAYLGALRDEPRG